MDIDISAWDDTISIGLEKSRWEAVKLELSFSLDESVAKLLLNLYSVWSKPKVVLKDVFPTSKQAVPLLNDNVPALEEEASCKGDIDDLGNHDPLALSADSVVPKSRLSHKSQDTLMTKPPKCGPGKGRKKCMRRLCAQGRVPRDKKISLKEVGGNLHSGAFQSNTLLENSVLLPTTYDGFTGQHNVLPCDGFTGQHNVLPDTCIQGWKDQFEVLFDHEILLKTEPIQAELSQEANSKTRLLETKLLPTGSTLMEPCKTQWGPVEMQQAPTEPVEMQQAPTEPVEMQQAPTEPVEMHSAPTEPVEMQPAPIELVEMLQKQTKPDERPELLTDPSHGNDSVDEDDEDDEIQEEGDNDDTIHDPDFSILQPNYFETNLRGDGAKRQSRRQSGYAPENIPEELGTEVKRRPRKNSSDSGPIRLPILLQHFKEMKGIEKVTCNECGKNFKPKCFDLSRHLRTDHGLVLLNGETSVRPLMCSRGSCFNTTFSSLAEYNHHMAVCHDKGSSEGKAELLTEKICDLCGITVKGSLSSHIKERHEKHEMVICPHSGCGKTFRKARLKDHIHQIHVPMHCPHPGCDQVMQRSLLKTHKRKHILHQLPKLSCPHCSSTCTYSHHLKRHINEVHNPKRFQCPEYGCDLAFKRMATLTQHQRIHLNNKPFQCKWCNFLGVQQNNIRSHALTTHPKEFRSAQENREKYWSGTGSGTGSGNGVRTRPSPDSCSVPPK